MLKATITLGAERIPYVVYGRTLEVLTERANREAKARQLKVMSFKVEKDR